MSFLSASRDGPVWCWVVNEFAPKEAFAEIAKVKIRVKRLSTLRFEFSGIDQANVVWLELESGPANWNWKLRNWIDYQNWQFAEKRDTNLQVQKIRWKMHQIVYRRDLKSCHKMYPEMNQ